MRARSPLSIFGVGVFPLRSNHSKTEQVSGLHDFSRVIGRSWSVSPDPATGSVVNIRSRSRQLARGWRLPKALPFSIPSPTEPVATTTDRANAYPEHDSTDVPRHRKTTNEAWPIMDLASLEPMMTAPRSHWVERLWTSPVRGLFASSVQPGPNTQISHHEKATHTAVDRCTLLFHASCSRTVGGVQCREQHDQLGITRNTNRVHR